MNTYIKIIQARIDDLLAVPEVVDKMEMRYTTARINGKSQPDAIDVARNWLIMLAIATLIKGEENEK